MRQQPESELKQAQVTLIRSMDDPDRSFLTSQDSQVDEPDIGQTSGYYQSHQPIGDG